MPRKNVRRKHIPQRTCAACREVQSKRSLIRIVRGGDGIRVDPSGKMAGRGAYLHNQRSCWEQGLKGSLAAALRTELTAADREWLLTYMMQLPEEEPEHTIKGGK